MTTDFQKNLLTYLLQTPESSQFFPLLDSALFDLAITKIAFDILSSYYKQYGRLPTASIAEQLLQQELTDTAELPEGLTEQLTGLFQDFRKGLTADDTQFVRDNFVKLVQEKRSEEYIMKYGDDKMSLDQLTSKLGQLSLMDKQAETLSMSNLLIQDRVHHNDDQIDGAPTFLHDLNRMTSARGFYSPQLIIFMSGPKHFKTGVIIKLAVEYARDGYNVYYADGENGLRSIRNRSKMAIMECTLRELYDADVAPEINITLENFHKYMGGDLFIDYYPAGTASVGDVRNRLRHIKESRGWSPDIIVWDPIDSFLPTDINDQRKDVRHQIQKVYHEAIALNNELGTFAFGPSQVNKAAVSKKVFDIRDLSEDFGKAANAHGIFAICATPDELEQGIRRILPVAQREGEKYTGHNQCVVKVDESRMIVKEVDKDEYYANIEDD